MESSDYDPFIIRILNFLNILEIIPLKNLNRRFYRVIDKNCSQFQYLDFTSHKIKRINNMDVLWVFTEFQHIKGIQMCTAHMASA